MSTTTTTAPAAASAPAKSKRGREGALDMVRSLGLCLLVVVPIWFLAQAPDSAEQAIRVVDQAPQVAAWQASADPAPAPQGVPEGWQATVAVGERSPVGLRLGWVTAPERYVEYAAAAQATEGYVEQLTGARTSTGTVDVDGTPWERYVEDDGSASLVRRGDGVTVVVGTLRSTATEDELLALARSVRPLP